MSEKTKLLATFALMNPVLEEHEAFLNGGRKDRRQQRRAAGQRGTGPATFEENHFAFSWRPVKELYISTPPFVSKMTTKGRSTTALLGCGG